jgi:hypothetical protein
MPLKNRRNNPFRQAVFPGGTPVKIFKLESDVNLNNVIHPSNNANPYDPEQYMNSVFGKNNYKFLSNEGIYGHLYTVKYTEAVLDFMRDTLTNHVIGKKKPAKGETVVVKITVPRLYQAWRLFVRDNVHEAAALSYVSDACTKLTCSRNTVCGSKIAPRFYFAGAEPDRNLFVTIMSLVQGVTLARALGGGRDVTARLYVAVEKAVVSMWLMGVAHADLHWGNIMVDGDEAKIVDYGYAVIIPPERRAAIKKDVEQQLEALSSLSNAAWYSGSQTGKYVNAVMASRRFSQYNPDGKMLRLLWNEMSQDERAKIPALRLKAWACSLKRNRNDSRNRIERNAKRRRFVRNTRLRSALKTGGVAP